MMICTSRFSRRSSVKCLACSAKGSGLETELLVPSNSGADCCFDALIRGQIMPASENDKYVMLSRSRTRRDAPSRTYSCGQ